MEAKHISGPWVVLEHNGVFVTTAGGLTICDVTYQLPTMENGVVGEYVRLANAALIASAPKMAAEITSLRQKVEELREALKSARLQLCILGGDPAKDNPNFGDQVQRAVLELIDAALSASQGEDQVRREG